MRDLKCNNSQRVLNLTRIGNFFALIRSGIWRYHDRKIALSSVLVVYSHLTLPLAQGTHPSSNSRLYRVISSYGKLVDRFYGISFREVMSLRLLRLFTRL